MAVTHFLSSLTVLFFMASAASAQPYWSLSSVADIPTLAAQGSEDGELGRLADQETRENVSIFDPSLPNPSNLFNTERDRSILPDDLMTQVTPVSELTDVQPTDWAFQALHSLAQRYDCITGYPDSTFRGNRALTRYEFAAGLMACLERLPPGVTPEEVLTWQRLKDEFAPELATLGVRVEALEARTTQLESTSFSPTVLMGGQVILGLAAASGGEPPGLGETNAVLNHQTQLAIVSSFTGKDRLQLFSGWSIGYLNG